MDKSMEEFQQYIYGIDFPADREEVAAVAQDRGAPDNLVQKIRTQTENALRTLTRFFKRYEAHCRATKVLGSGSFREVDL